MIIIGLTRFIISYKEEVYELKNTLENVALQNKRNLPIIESENNKERTNKIVEYLTNISNQDWEDLTKQSDDLSDYVSSLENEIIGVSYLFHTGKKLIIILPLDMKCLVG